MEHVAALSHDGAPAAERPKYGALNHRRRPAGGAPRFGSAHFRLTADTLARTTFCYPDSVFEPVDFGVADRMSLEDLRGPEAADLGREPAVDGVLDARIIGRARGSHDPLLLKEVWHLVARFGG